MITSTTDINPLSPPDAHPIVERRHPRQRPPHRGAAAASVRGARRQPEVPDAERVRRPVGPGLSACRALLPGAHLVVAQVGQDRKSTRLNSSTSQNSYAHFYL